METKEKDKKYSIILGIMILLFLIVVGIAIAWGLGYVHFGKQNEVENNSNEISFENAVGSNTESQIQDSVNNIEVEENTDVIQRAYAIYTNFEWVKKDECAIGVKVEDGKVILNGTEKDITFAYGNPIIATGNAGHSFDSVYVINDTGEAYVNNVYEVNYEYEKDNFKKMTFSEKIVDMGFMKNDNSELLGPYFMTENGKVLNSEGHQLK